MSLPAAMILAAKQLEELLQQLENERQQIAELRSLLFSSSEGR